METGIIAISSQFFANELKSYSDWRDAFWRELVQNSVDAGCKNIRIHFEGNEDEPVVVFCDDGPGMSREVLRDVYFQLGATTKGDGDIGGFGRARMLTCFAHQDYWVKSRDYLASGSGASYQIGTNPDGYTRGCEVGVRLHDSGGVASMKERLTTFLSTCQLDCHIILEGEDFHAWTYRYRKADELSFAAIYVNRSQPSEVIVRVNGVAMFFRWTSAKARIVLEIPPEVARTVLTSNRDGLRHQYQAEFDQYLEKISVDCNSAIKGKFTPQKTVFGDAMRSVRRKSTAPAIAIPDSDLTQMAYVPFQSCPPSFCSPLVVPQSPTDPHLPQFVLYTDCGNTRLLAAAKKFTSEAISGTRKERLLAAWTCACEIALDGILQITGGDYIEFAPGFLFSEDAKAVCHFSNGGYALLLRPVDERGRLAYNISSPDTAHQLLAIAAHEAAHVLHSNHNEDYAATLTELFGRISAQVKRVRGALRVPKPQLV